MKQSASLGFIFVTLLIDVMGLGLLIPVLPRFIAHLSHSTPSEGAIHYGVLLALYGGMQFLFAPLFGTLSDKVGRRPVLLLALFFTGVDYVIMALAPSLPWLYVGRILTGVTGASFTAGTAYIADISPPEKRSQNFGIIGAAFGIGFILGPGLGGQLGNLGERVPFWVAAGLCFANLLYGWFVLPESLSKEKRRNISWLEANPLGSLMLLGRYPILWGLAGAMACSNLAHRCLESTWVLSMTAKFGWGPAENGNSLAAFGVVAVIYQMGVARLVLPKLGERRVMLLAGALAVVEFLSYALATRGWMIYVIMCVVGLAFLGGQVTQGFLSHQVRENEQGALQGALASLTSVTGVIGPLIGTSLFAYFTSPKAPIYHPGAAFFLAAGLNLIALIITARALARLPETAPRTTTAPIAVGEAQ